MCSAHIQFYSVSKKTHSPLQKRCVTDCQFRIALQHYALRDPIRSYITQALMERPKNGRDHHASWTHTPRSAIELHFHRYMLQWMLRKDSYASSLVLPITPPAGQYPISDVNPFPKGLVPTKQWFTGDVCVKNGGIPRAFSGSAVCMTTLVRKTVRH